MSEDEQEQEQQQGAKTGGERVNGAIEQEPIAVVQQESKDEPPASADAADVEESDGYKVDVDIEEQSPEEVIASAVNGALDKSLLVEGDHERACDSMWVPESALPPSDDEDEDEEALQRRDTYTSEDFEEEDETETDDNETLLSSIGEMRVG